MAFLQNSKLCAQTFRKIPHFLDVYQLNFTYQRLFLSFAINDFKGKSW